MKKLAMKKTPDKALELSKRNPRRFIVASIKHQIFERHDEDNRSDVLIQGPKDSLERAERLFQECFDDGQYTAWLLWGGKTIRYVEPMCPKHFGSGYKAVECSDRIVGFDNELYEKAYVHEKHITFSGHHIVNDGGHLKIIRDKINTKANGDYGADPIENGMFRMVPSGDIVDYNERCQRLRKKYHETF